MTHASMHCGVPIGYVVKYMIWSATYCLLHLHAHDETCSSIRGSIKHTVVFMLFMGILFLNCCYFTKLCGHHSTTK